MDLSFHETFEQHAVWRRGFSHKLKQLGGLLSSHGLLDASLQERLQHLENRVRSDKILVAFVAELSRGKSELINALFFADYGCRILPASAGRTTMCPVELGFDAGLAPSLRLLSIDTRLLPQSLADWRTRPSAWREIALEAGNAGQIAACLQKVSEVRRVSVAQARSLGFWNDDLPEENPLQSQDGSVEVPMWRHALINLPHPLLKQGLVVLDTPGLNAVGAEPELTVNLLPQAHAVVFVLGADSGVTRSDLAIWREHLGSRSADKDSRLVVLNKVDTLWDSLSSAAQVQARLQRQCSTVAQVLGVGYEQVIAASAQKGLVAKIAGDAALLQASGLPGLEEALSSRIVGRRQALLQAAVTEGISALRSEIERIINIQRRDLDEQMLELRSLSGKNVSVVDAMQRRIEQEQQDFEKSVPRVHALRSVHLKLLQQVFAQLGAKSLQIHMAELSCALQQKGMKVGLRKQYTTVFSRLAGAVTQAEAAALEIQEMLAGTFRQLNAEFGFSLQVPPLPSLEECRQALVRTEQDQLQYAGVGNALRLAQSGFAERLERALAVRLRAVLETAASALDGWSTSATAQLDAQLRERQQGFVRRKTAVNRIREAAAGLKERLDELEESHRALNDSSELLHIRIQALQASAPQDAEKLPMPTTASVA